MKWSEIEIHSVNEAVEPITYALNDSGASGVSIEDSADLTREHEDRFGEIYDLQAADYPAEGVIIKAYFLTTDDFLAMVPEIEARIRGLAAFDIPLGDLTFQVNEVNDEEWATAWKKYYHPVKITDYITVVPTWEDYTPETDDEMIIELDPGMAFGTGTHPTTQLCVQALEKIVKPGDEVIDVGTGSGVLSIASAKLGAKSVLATDLDEVAVRAARENIAQNHCENIVTIQQNDLLKGITQKADVIVANILAEVIVLFPEDVHAALKPNGIFIASGIIEPKREMVTEALIEAGLTVYHTEQITDWVAIYAKRGE
ncbi:50S ribosomal protein L11 methyltransferase [Listeria booriae]|uniref:50S ribosomal protein L11 methyltransferase n=1 Tax=Listeria booriae TaxID=1552123 RepID=UPI00162531CE|nr:50S ribosomal protein L11 methyltransferase [Listeria booriae]MBC2390072.1 50S ribosomal protein L11 methyltransferase [Listeria booriae]